MIVRQTFETISSNQRESAENDTTKSSSNKSMNVGKLIKLLVNKNKNVDQLMKTAVQQKDIQAKIDETKKKLSNADERIKHLHQSFKKAEIIQANAMFVAKELLKKIDVAQAAPVGSEDIVKYAHKISSSCSTVSPLNWSPGDPRRPYPQDLEMKLGLIGQLSNLPSRMDSSETADTVSQLKPLGTDGITFTAAPKQNFNGMQWATMQTLAAEVKPDDAELMSSDSSSSESSESSFGD